MMTDDIVVWGWGRGGVVTCVSEFEAVCPLSVAVRQQSQWFPTATLTAPSNCLTRQRKLSSFIPQHTFPCHSTTCL